MSSDKKNETKLRKTEKMSKKKMTLVKVKMRYQIFKPFEFEPKTKK